MARLEAEVAPLGLPVERVTSQAEERRRFLLRPDLGRRLAENTALPQAPGSVALVVADGLCASGVQQQAPALLSVLVPALGKAGFTPGPIIIAQQARVALGDDVAEAVQAADTDIEQVRHFTSRMQIEVKRLTAMISDLVALSQVQGDLALRNSVPVEVRSIIAEAVDAIMTVPYEPSVDA